MPEITPRTSPPTRRIRGFRGILDLGDQVQLRRRSFWAGWGGAITTIFMGVLVVALLVGWVLLWVNRPGGANMALLTMGCIAFTLVLALLATLQNRLTAHWRLRQAEALFLTGVSHNLRTPIGAIRAAAQALERPALDPDKRQRLVQAIIHETRRLALRVDNVIESGRMEVERLSFGGEPLDVGGLIGKIVEEHRAIIETRGGTITLDAPAAVGVQGDERALRLMLENMLDNAVKYSDPTPDIRVTARQHGAFALLQIQDGGIGFAQPEGAELFRQFFRGDTGRSGSGLGLPLARAVARGHGGEIHLTSDGRGKGAVAEIWLLLGGA